jgi:hypothetical protein
VSHDDNATGLTATQPPPRPGHASAPSRLERPNLFFGTEEHQVDDVNADRVRLLHSEGDSRRQASRHAHPGKRGAPASTSAWWLSAGWGRALVALMSLGVVAVLYSFVQVLRQPHAMSAQARAMATADLNAFPPTAASSASMDATAGRVGSTSAPHPPEPARIEVPPTAAAATARSAEAPSHSATTPSLPSPGTAGGTASGPAAIPAARHLIARAAADAAKLNAPPGTAGRPPGGSSYAPQRPRSSEDVALLEAMMRHASARKAPPSAGEALQACTRLSAPDAAVCKAKACVQHPTAPQCHSEAY